MSHVNCSPSKSRYRSRVLPTRKPKISKRYSRRMHERLASRRKYSKTFSRFDYTDVLPDHIDHYKEMTQWHISHQYAFWRSRHLEYEFENHGLHEQYPHVYKASKYRKSAATRTHEDEATFYKNVVPNLAGKSNDTNELEFEVDENWLNFMEQSERHRMELREQRKSGSKDSESDNKPHGSSELESDESKEKSAKGKMEVLYGEGAATISACETAIQFTFERHVARRKTPFWPNIPFE